MISNRRQLQKVTTKRQGQNESAQYITSNTLIMIFNYSPVDCWLGPQEHQANTPHTNIQRHKPDKFGGINVTLHKKRATVCESQYSQYQRELLTVAPSCHEVMHMRFSTMDSDLATSTTQTLPFFCQTPCSWNADLRPHKVDLVWTKLG